MKLTKVGNVLQFDVHVQYFQTHSQNLAVLHCCTCLFIANANSITVQQIFFFVSLNFKIALLVK